MKQKDLNRWHCGTCIFYWENVGECRFNPPSIASDDESAIWPRIIDPDSSGCGKWMLSRISNEDKAHYAA